MMYEREFKYVRCIEHSGMEFSGAHLLIAMATSIKVKCERYTNSGDTAEAFCLSVLRLYVKSHKIMNCLLHISLFS